MSMPYQVLNGSNQVIGVIYTIDGQGTQQIRDASGTQILGTYHPGINKTTDQRGQWVGNGNLLTSLLGRGPGW